MIFPLIWIKFTKESSLENVAFYEQGYNSALLLPMCFNHFICNFLTSFHRNTGAYNICEKSDLKNQKEAHNLKLNMKSNSDSVL